MILKYNDFDFSDLGELTFTQASEMDGPADQPQRARVTLRVRVDVFERSYDANRQLLDRCRTALKLPNAILQWTNDAAGVDYVNQTATLASSDLPEEWGEYHQTLNLVFTYYEQTPGGAANNLPMLFARQGSSPVKFDVVSRWSHGATVERYSTLRKQRKETHGTIRAEGLWYGDTTQSLDARRAAFAQQAREFNESMNGAEGVLAYGAGGAVFQGTVRIEQWNCEVDQAVNAIAFSFTAGYTLLPNEADYYTAEFAAAEQDDYSGMLNLEVSGKVAAATLAAAKTKLDALLATVSTQHGYDKAQPRSKNVSDANVDGLDGAAFIELTFSAGWRRWKNTNENATFQCTGRTKPVPLGEVRVWHYRYSAQRFNEMRSQRRHATGSVEAAGTWTADPSMSVKDRRAALKAMERDMETEVNGADGTLIRGDWTKVVRVEDFQAEINQAETGIDWTMSANWSEFPNEGGYATADFTVDERQDPESGDDVMALAGRIEAPNGALARSKLDSLRTALLKLYGWSLNQRLQTSTSLNGIDANGDRTAGLASVEGLEGKGDFSAVSLSFNENYRRRTPGTLVSSTLQRLDREDVPSQTLVTTYSGSVTASGTTADAAYATALARARALGANREAAIDESTVFRGSTIAQDTRQVRVDGPTEFVRLTFTYEYVSKLAAGRAFIELTTSTSKDTFGVDAETCSGVVMARDQAAAEAIYEAEVLGLYGGRLIRSAQTGSTTQRTQTGTDSYRDQQVRFEFNLSVYSPKAAGLTAFKYTYEVDRDLLTAELRTVVSGSVFAKDRPTADAALDALFQFLKLTNNRHSRRVEDRERTVTGTSVLDVLLKLDFDEEFIGRVTGLTGVAEMNLVERVQFSGTRWTVQNIPYDDGVIGQGGISIPQPTGHEPGSRTVTGSVTAVSLATALAWARKQKVLLTGDKRGKKYFQPPQEETGYQFVPRIDGVATGAGANVRLHQVSFSYGEILPYYPSP